jgi:hypothetical protein
MPFAGKTTADLDTWKADRDWKSLRHIFTVWGLEHVNRALHELFNPMGVRLTVPRGRQTGKGRDHIAWQQFKIGIELRVEEPR